MWFRLLVLPIMLFFLVVSPSVHADEVSLPLVRNSGEPVLSDDPLLVSMKIAFVVGDGHYNPEIYVMDADGSSQIRLTDDPAHEWSPSWSTDDNKIAFVSDRDGYPNGMGEIYLMNVDGSGLARISPKLANLSKPVWSPVVYSMAKP